MDERSVFDLTPQMVPATEKLFSGPRLFLVVTVLIAMLAAAAFAR